MPMRINQWMDQRLKNWLLGGAAIFVLVAAAAACCIHAGLGVTWTEVTPAAIWLVTIQIAWFGAMYFIRKRYKAGKNIWPGVLIVGIFCWGVVMLGMHYSARWGVMTPAQLYSNYKDFSIFMVVVIVVSLFLPLGRKA